MNNIDCDKADYKTDRKIELEKKLEIAVNALEDIRNELLKINLAGLSYEDRHTIYNLMFDNGTISKALAKIQK